MATPEEEESAALRRKVAEDLALVIQDKTPEMREGLANVVLAVASDVLEVAEASAKRHGLTGDAAAVVKAIAAMVAFQRYSGEVHPDGLAYLYDVAESVHRSVIAFVTAAAPPPPPEPPA